MQGITLCVMYDTLLWPLMAWRRLGARLTVATVMLIFPVYIRNPQGMDQVLDTIPSQVSVARIPAIYSQQLFEITFAKRHATTQQCIFDMYSCAVIQHTRYSHVGILCVVVTYLCMLYFVFPHCTCYAPPDHTLSSMNYGEV